MKENYFLDCETCESKFELFCIDVSFEYVPEYCPFCGSVLDEEEEDTEEDEGLDQDD